MARRLVHNELLCLIYNNIQSVDDNNFLSSVSQFFKNSDVIDARKLLCRDMKNANCRLCSENEFFKTKLDKLGDIIRMMKHIFDVNLQHAMPRYCAIDLGKIPFLKFGGVSDAKVSSVGKLNQRVEKIENMITHLTTKLSDQIMFQDSGTQASLHDIPLFKFSRKRHHKPLYISPPNFKSFQYPYNEFAIINHEKEKWVCHPLSQSTEHHMEGRKSEGKFTKHLSEDQETDQYYEESQDLNFDETVQSTLPLNKA